MNITVYEKRPYLAKEIWKNIPRFHGKYQVSNLGRVRSNKRILKSFCSDGTWLVTLKKNFGKDKYYNRHLARLVAKLFVPNPHHFTQIEYINGNKNDYQAANIRWHVPAKYIRYKKKLIIKKRKYKSLYKYNDEIWKPIPHYKDYLISSYGRVIERGHQQKIGTKGHHRKYFVPWHFMKSWHGQITLQSSHNRLQCKLKYLMARIFPKKVQNLPGEYWKNVPNFEKFYQISNMGRIKRKARVIHRRRQGNEYLPEVIKRPVSMKDHYYYASFSSDNGHHAAAKLSLIVAKLFLPAPQSSRSIKLLRHKNGNLADNRASNLKWVDTEYKRRHINALRKEKSAKEEMELQTKAGEIWKDIPYYKNKYQVSNLGRVRAIGRIVPRKNGSSCIFHSKIMTTHKMKNGYLAVNLCTNGRTQDYYVHRLVAKVFVSNPHDYPEINHKNEIRYDNRASNLEWCTAKYNDNYGHHSYREHIIQSRVNGRRVRLIKNSKHYDFETEIAASKWIQNHIKSNWRLSNIYRHINKICCHQTLRIRFAGYLIKPLQKKII